MPLSLHLKITNIQKNSANLHIIKELKVLESGQNASLLSSCWEYYTCIALIFIYLFILRGRGDTLKFLYKISKNQQINVLVEGKSISPLSWNTIVFYHQNDLNVKNNKSKHYISYFYPSIGRVYITYKNKCFKFELTLCRVQDYILN